MSLQVGIDVSPLALTRAGTARHIRSLLDALEHEDVELRRYGFGGSRRLPVPAPGARRDPGGPPPPGRRGRGGPPPCPPPPPPPRPPGPGGGPLPPPPGARA